MVYENGKGIQFTTAEVCRMLVCNGKCPCRSTVLTLVRSLGLVAMGLVSNDGYQLMFSSRALFYIGERTKYKFTGIK